MGSAAYSPDGQTIAAACDEDGVLLWDVPSGSQVAALKCKEMESAYQAVYSPNGRLLAAVGDERAVCLWDVRKRQLVRRFEGFVDELIYCAAFAPDGGLLAAGDGKLVRVLDVQSGRIVMTLEGHSDSVNDLAFSPDGQTLASDCYDGTVLLWSINR